MYVRPTLQVSLVLHINLLAVSYSCYRLMVITNLDLLCTALMPYETDSPLVIDPDTPLAGSIAGKFFQAVVGRYPQVVDPLGIVEHTKLAPTDSLYLYGKSPGKVAVPYCAGFVIGK